MPVLNQLFTISSDADPGAVYPVTAAPTDLDPLAAGVYKIAAMGSGLLWKLGSDDVTVATGAYLAAGDQEVILVKTPQKLSWILSALDTTDGEINIVPIEVFQVPGEDARNYRLG